MTKPKMCGFCGYGQVRYVKVGKYDAVECVFCDLRGPSDNGEDFAISLWNRLQDMLKGSHGKAHREVA